MRRAIADHDSRIGDMRQQVHNRRKWAFIRHYYLAEVVKIIGIELPDVTPGVCTEQERAAVCEVFSLADGTEIRWKGHDQDRIYAAWISKDDVDPALRPDPFGHPDER
jgi:hypothetical protein